MASNEISKNSKEKILDDIPPNESVDDKSKSKDSKLFLELGQFIEIEASENEVLHNKTFFIDYLDEHLIVLINDIEKTKHEININNGNLTDESIDAIHILYEPDEKGYARQNNLNVGQWISIEFAGDVPTIFNGQITDLENDMIEISLFPNKEKIYIDFEYKGIPKIYQLSKLDHLKNPRYCQP